MGRGLASFTSRSERRRKPFRCCRHFAAGSGLGGRIVILFARQAFAVFRKDITAELRRGHHILSIVLFGLLLLLLFSFALSVDPDLMRKMSAGLFWLAILFTSILSLGHSFRNETEDGQWEGLLLLGIDPKALFVGKLLTNL